MKLRDEVFAELNKYTEKLDDDLKGVIDECCTEGNIKKVMRHTIRGVIAQIISEEVRKWCDTDEMKTIIKKTISKNLEEEIDHAYGNDLYVNGDDRGVE